jgi:hypothetical protein
VREVDVPHDLELQLSENVPVWHEGSFHVPILR